jgi:hypothetical protein
MFDSLSEQDPQSLLVMAKSMNLGRGDNKPMSKQEFKDHLMNAPSFQRLNLNMAKSMNEIVSPMLKRNFSMGDD